MTRFLNLAETETGFLRCALLQAWGKALPARWLAMVRSCTPFLTRLMIDVNGNSCKRTDRIKRCVRDLKSGISAGFFYRYPKQTPLLILRNSTSNFDFHYMGSAKIMAQIGKGFAEAMAALVR
jgi:hypothetical protein